MSSESIDRLIWLLIYGGMAALGLGVAVAKSSPAPGYALISGGALVVIAGVVLLVVRSRIKDRP